jgi:toxin FitB
MTRKRGRNLKRRSRKTGLASGGVPLSRVVFLDSSPLGLLAHPRRNSEIAAWLYGILNAGNVVAVPEIADYEVRRELIRARKPKSIRRLDELKSLVEYVPITTTAMLLAAEFWAEVRMRGEPTSHQHALDGDVILAGQARTYGGASSGLVVATENVSHVSRFVPAEYWRDIS